MAIDYTLIVAARPVAGREADWNRWYDETHLDEVLTVQSFVSAVRLRAITSDPSLGSWLAVYGIAAVDDAAADAALRRLQSAALTVTDAMDGSSVTFSLYRNGSSRP